MTNYCKEVDGKLQWTFDGEKLEIEPWGDNSLRVRAVPSGEIPNHSYALLKQKMKHKAVIDIGDHRATITNGILSASILYIDPKFSGRQKEVGQLTFYRDGKKILEEIGIGGRLKLKARNFKSLDGDYKLSMTFVSQPNEMLYGMGQYQDGLFDLKGSSRELAQRNTQASVPFYYSSLNYGFLWNNPAIGEVHFDKTRTQWTAEETDLLDYWITAGDSPKKILEQYSLVTGRVPQMPDYGMGLWQSRMRYYNQEQVIEVAEKYKELDIPVDVIIIDFFHWNKQGDYAFDPRFFPNPAKMTKILSDLGIKTMVSVWPQVDNQSKNFIEMRKRGLLVKNNQGIPIQMDFEGNVRFLDFTNPKAQKFLWQMLKKNYQDKGISMFWLDEAEPEYTVYDYRNYRYYKGNVMKVGNIYPMYYTKAVYDGYKSEGKDKIINLVRCAWAGSQRFGALVWSGDVRSDFISLQNQIVAGLQMGMSGIPWWTTDTGGFHGGDINSEDFRELLIRWFEFSTFSPVLRLHGERLPFEEVTAPDGSEVLHTGAPNELWSFGDKVLEILKKFVRLREDLRPYIKEVMNDAHNTGSPVMRMLFYEFPEDENTWGITDEYFFGKDLLVAPIVKKGSFARKVYLPKGCKWVLLNSGEYYKGGQSYEVEAPLGSIPIFTRVEKQNEFQFIGDNMKEPKDD